MTTRLRDLPHAALVLALGMALEGASPRRTAAEGRGLLARLLVAWSRGDVRCAPRAALICHTGRPVQRRRACAAAVAGVAGWLLLEVPVLGLALLGADLVRLPVAPTCLAVLAVRAVLVIVSLVRSRRDRVAVAAEKAWHLDVLAAWPAGTGAGSALLDALLAEADAAAANVALICMPGCAPLYRARGFRTTGVERGQVRMRRPAYQPVTLAALLPRQRLAPGAHRTSEPAFATRPRMKSRSDSRLR